MLAGFLVLMLGTTACLGDNLDDCQRHPDPSVALAACDRVLNEAGISAERGWSARESRAAAYYKMGDYLAAIAAYSELIETRKWSNGTLSLLDPRYDRAKVHEALGAWKDAFEDYWSAEQITSIGSSDQRESAEREFLRGSALLAKGELEGAANLLCEAARLSNFEDSEYTVACVRAFNRQYERSPELTSKDMAELGIDRIDQTIARDPQNADAYLVRGDLNRLRRDFARAEADYSAAIRLRSDHAVAYHGRARVHAAQRNLDGALADLDSALRSDGDNSVLYVARAVMRGMKGDADGQIADYGKALELEPFAADTYLLRAWALLKAGNVRAALVDANRALAIEPKLMSALLVRGRAYHELGYANEADADWQAAFRLDAKLKGTIEALKGSGFVPAPGPAQWAEKKHPGRLAAPRLVLTNDNIRRYLAARQELGPVHIYCDFPRKGDRYWNAGAYAKHDIVARRHGFKDLDEYEAVCALVHRIRLGIGADSKKYVEPRHEYEQKLAELNADTTLSDRRKARDIENVRMYLDSYWPIQVPGNIALVERYYDQIAAEGSSGQSSRVWPHGFDAAHVFRYIETFREMDALPAGSSREQLEAVARKYGFGDFEEYEALGDGLAGVVHSIEEKEKDASLKVSLEMRQVAPLRTKLIALWRPAG